jgi:hypothetical protein
VRRLLILWSRYLEEHCKALGYEVTLEPVTYTFRNTNSQLVTATAHNVICKKHPQAGPTAHIAVIGAHYDSTSEHYADWWRSVKTLLRLAGPHD